MNVATDLLSVVKIDQAGLVEVETLCGNTNRAKVDTKQEEDKIRANPIARTTDLLKKVFGYADTKK